LPRLILCVEAVLISTLLFYDSLAISDREAAAVGCLIVYFFFLWQFDHGVAPLVWHYKDKIYIDGWIFGKIEITDYYNICMLFLLFCPPLVFFILAL